jgi:hypothetical protein
MVQPTCGATWGRPVEELIALRDAVLRYQAHLRQPFADFRGLRLAETLARWHLPWAAWLVAMLSGLRMVLSRRTPALQASGKRAVALYRHHTGQDPQVAWAEIHRLSLQLLVLGDGLDPADPSRSGLDSGRNRMDLEAAAEALVGYHLAGRRTDDALLGEVLAAWAAVEELEQPSRKQFVVWDWRRKRPTVDAKDGAGSASRERYLTAWRRWLDRRAGGTSAGS